MLQMLPEFPRSIRLHRTTAVRTASTRSSSSRAKSVQAMTFRKRTVRNAEHRWSATVTTFRLKPSLVSRATKAPISTSTSPANIRQGRINIPKSFSARPMFSRPVPLQLLRIKRHSALSKSTLTKGEERFPVRRRQGSQSAAPVSSARPVSIREEWLLFRMRLRRRTSPPFSIRPTMQQRGRPRPTLTSMRFMTQF